MPSKVLGILLALLLAPTLAFAQSSEPVVEEAPPVEEVVVDQPVVEIASPFVATVATTGRGLKGLYPDPALAGGGLNSVPSPVGAPLFEQILGRQTGAELRLARDEMAMYAYPCETGQCVGPALSVWLAMPVEQRRGYLQAMVGMSQQLFPNARMTTIQVRNGLNGDMVECATTATGELMFVEGACPR